MFRAIFAVATVAFIMLAGSILVVPAANGNNINIGPGQMAFLGNFPASQSSGQANFTVYVPPTPYASAVANSAMSFIGVSPQKFGLLWAFSVPDTVASEVNMTLHRLTAGSGITTFYSESGTTVTPSISYSYAGQNINIPFAFTPDILAKAYNFTWALHHGINGSGITIGIIDAYGNPNIMYDLRAFDAANGLPPVDLSIVYPNGEPGTYNSTWAMETSTDVEWAHALAPAAKIVLLISTSSFTSDLQNVVSYAISNHIANILSLSWSTPESGLTVNSELTYSKIYAEAASQGITVLAASGDSGAYNSEKQLTVNFPASDPYVTSVGGTSLYAFNDRFQQSGWGGVVNGQSYGSGGGFSSVFNTPYWQSVKGYNESRRGVPDVAMDANKYTGVYVISSGGQYIVGGTSVATPIWADVVALIEQYTGVHLHSVNPLLYQIARTSLYNSSFTQILTGTNGYYQNTPYWNPVTGLGTPKVSSLLNASRDLLDGYGGIAVFNGTKSYNATIISANLNLTPLQGRLANNGTTFYYDGFYLNPLNYLKFGVTLNSTGEALMLAFSQAGNLVERTYGMPGGFGGQLTLFNIKLSFNGSSVNFSTSGGFSQSLPAFLNFSGEMSPALGTTQMDSQSNLTIINNGTFSSISVSNGSAPVTPGYVYFQHYNGINSTTYSTIDASAGAGEIVFYSSSAPEGHLIGSHVVPGPQITYYQGYGHPALLLFYLQGVNSGITWSVNSSPAKANTFVAYSGGAYNVSATYTDADKIQRTVSRNISIPYLHLANVSVNYTIKGTQYPGTEITAMWFYNYHYSGPGMQIPAMNGTTAASASSTGFYGDSGLFTGSQNITFRLEPIKVNVSLFVFNANSTVTFNNETVQHQGGYHYRMMTPGSNVTINVTKPGYGNQTDIVYLEPGKNLSLQILLQPTFSGTHTLTGSVSDILYSFPIGNALVRVNSSMASYSNSSGLFFLYPATGKYNVSATAEMYDNFSTPLNISSPTILNIRMTPAKISVSSGENVSITHYFPLLFYFGYLSWTPYKGQNFSIYQVYVSNNQNFLSPDVTTVSSQNTSYTFLSGLVPGSTYYISVVLRLSNSQVYQSQVVKISYSNPVYLGINLVIAAAIGFYAYIGYRVFSKKRRRDEIQ